MRKPTLILLVLALAALAGYLLGTEQGRAQGQQLADKVRRRTDHIDLTDAAESARDAASDAAASASEAVGSSAGSVGGS